MQTMSGPKSNDRKEGALERLRVGASKRAMKFLAQHAEDQFMPSTGVITRKEPKVGRNQPCPCGQTIDGKPVKFKNCCGG
jgi:uncharacterized protein YecA (UPF0149 family)